MANDPVPANDSTEALLLEFWPEHHAHQDSLRAARDRVNILGPQLGLLLAALQRELAHSGRGGEFHPWLRQHGVPRSTAYSLIRRFGTASQESTTKKCPLNTSSLPPTDPPSDLPTQAESSPASSTPSNQLSLKAKVVAG